MQQRQCVQAMLAVETEGVSLPRKPGSRPTSPYGNAYSPALAPGTPVVLDKGAWAAQQTQWADALDAMSRSHGSAMPAANGASPFSRV